MEGFAASCELATILSTTSSRANAETQCEKLFTAIQSISAPETNRIAQGVVVAAAAKQHLTLVDQSLSSGGSTAHQRSADTPIAWSKSLQSSRQNFAHLQDNLQFPETQTIQISHSDMPVEDLDRNAAAPAFAVEMEGYGAPGGLSTDSWWNTSFTAAGYDELAVLEPVMLFREAWDGT